MIAVSSPTNAEILRTFHLFADRWSMLCTKHGVFLASRVDMEYGFRYYKCPVCRSLMSFVPDGKMPVYDERPET